jgi:molybdopterin synthase sulfur carrier subunit
MIRVRYFASLRERLACDGEELALPRDASVGGLLALLAERGEPWAGALRGGTPVLAAVNQEMARPDQAVADGDEVAFFPPVTGG